MTEPEVVRRQGARVVVVDDVGRTLLLQGFDPMTPAVRYWFTPGGGIEPGETAGAAAVRELHEETGVVATAADLGEPVLRQTDKFPFEGRVYVQDNAFFLLRTAAFTAAPLRFEPHELRSVVRLAWFSLEELAVLDEPFYPPELPDLVRQAMTRR